MIGCQVQSNTKTSNPMNGPGRQRPSCISREMCNKFPTFGTKCCNPPSGITESLLCLTSSIVRRGPYIFGCPLTLNCQPSARDLTYTAMKYNRSAVQHSERSSCSHMQLSVRNVQTLMVTPSNSGQVQPRNVYCLPCVEGLCVVSRIRRQFSSL